MLCLALELVVSWVELGFSVAVEALGELLSINVPWNQTYWYFFRTAIGQLHIGPYLMITVNE